MLLFIGSIGVVWVLEGGQVLLPSWQVCWLLWEEKESSMHHVLQLLEDRQSKCCAGFLSKAG